MAATAAIPAGPAVGEQNPPVDGLVLAVAVALAFDVTNGFHDAANSIAALVATRAATPGQAVVLASVFHVLGPLLAGTAVADTIGGLVDVDASAMVAVVAAGITGALMWNLVTWWLGLPSSSSHALVGGLVGAALVDGGVGAVVWGGMDGIHPVGVLGVLLALAVSPVLGFAAGLVGSAAGRRALRRARRRAERPVKQGEWVTAATLAFSHGANDAQKTMGLITAMLIAAGRLDSFTVPLWVKLTAGLSLTFGTALGGWRIARTLGRGIYRIRPLDGLVSQGASSAVILSAAAVGAPVSTTHVVASSVVGVGANRGRRHVRWAVVQEMLAAWVVTMPAGATVAALALPFWRWLS
ncbi:MAG: inorganic phosphate transporter [Acidimicrobiales bacterium]|nr:inorganic phosphate transporter [Acidimicrobiales bacterium]